MAAATSGISDLKSALSNHSGLSRLCKYRLDMTGFGNLVPLSRQTVKDLDFFLEGVNVPGRTLSSVKYSVWDKPIDLPTGYENQELSLDFMMPNDYYIRDLFYQWQHNIIDHTSQLIRYLNEYICDINILILDDANKDSYQIKVYDAYPLSYSGQTFSAASAEYAKLSVTFSYGKMEEGKLNTLPSSGSGSEDLGVPPGYTDKARKHNVSGFVYNEETGLLENVNLPANVEEYLKTQALYGPGSSTDIAALGSTAGLPITNPTAGIVPPADNFNDTIDVDSIADLPNIDGTNIKPNVLQDGFVPDTQIPGSINNTGVDPVSSTQTDNLDFNPAETTNVSGTSNLTASQRQQKTYEAIILGPTPENAETYASGRPWIITADKWEGEVPSASYGNE